MSEDLAAYGWLTNTGVKFVVFVSCVGVGGGVREGELKSVSLVTVRVSSICPGSWTNKWESIGLQRTPNGIYRLGV